MNSLIDDLHSLKETFDSALNSATDNEAIEKIRIRFLGKKGELTRILKGMGKLSPDQRPILGQESNKLRAHVEASLAERKQAIDLLQENRRIKEETIDVSLPASSFCEMGCRHPLTQMTEQFTDIFIGMGYEVAEGPEIELDVNNFELLRIPKGHPARDDQDTFYISDELLLRSQTSPVQIRVMQTSRPPIRIICPGKVYRSDSLDATHSPIFHQIEGLVVDEGISMSDLVATLEIFARRVYGEETEIRLRPHHFPFTEPSCEVDISCWNCHGKDPACSTCRGEGWIEILGAGMVHPQVLANCNIDPRRYSGFAFGVGVERVAMGKYNIKDIRNFYENDLRFLRQFRQGGRV